MIKVIERKTGLEFQAKRIEGGFEVYHLEGERYKKLKESSFKKYFKVAGETSQPKKREATKEPKKDLSDEDREKMIAKIKKILNLSKNNPSTEEAIAAALQAQKLMSRYGIDEKELTLEEIKDEITSVFAEQKHNSHLLSWRKQLAVIVARNFKCKTYMDNQNVVFRGFTQDAKIALDVYMNLYTIANRLAGRVYAERKAETGSGKGVYNSFVLGFLSGVENALDEQCTALMIITPKAVEEEYEKFSQGFISQKSVIKGKKDVVYEQGVTEGKNAVKSRQLNSKKKGAKK